MWLTVEAWTQLLYVDVRGASLDALHRLIRCTPVREIAPSQTTVEVVVRAVQTACVLYGKHAYCLQRSAVVTRLLRRRGVPAELVIGCHLAPLRAHAWVEVAGSIVSDYEPGIEHYCVLDRW